jgi:hypothetical protein
MKAPRDCQNSPADDDMRAQSVFPLSLRMVAEMLAARGICATYEAVPVGKSSGRGTVKLSECRTDGRPLF